MKKIILFLSILIGVLSVKAQVPQTERPYSQQSTVIRLSLLAPYLGAEQKLSETISISGNIGVGGTIFRERINDVSRLRAIIKPYVSIEPRMYLGMKKRAAKGKRVDYFSGFYVGIPFTRFLTESRYSICSLFGFQRAFSEIGFFSIGLGPSYDSFEGNGEFEIVGGLSVGFILN